MALGSQLITKILSDQPKQPGAKYVKGIHSTERNYAIMCRLYYHFKIRGLNYEKAISLLNEEFFLSESRLQQIIVNDRDTLNTLKEMNVDKKYLAKKLPHFNWN
jgi:hypothetical protein